MQKGISKIYVYLTYIASGLIIVGANLPLYIEAKSKTNIVTVSRTDKEGILLLITSLIVIMLRYYKKKKYILAPIIFQTGIMIYYIYLFISNKKIYMVHVGFMFEMLGLVFLIASMFVDINIEKDIIHDISTLKIIKVDESYYDDKIVNKDIKWIILIVILTSIMLGIKIQINRQENALLKIKKESIKQSLNYNFEIEQQYSILYNNQEDTEVYNTI